MTITEKIAYIKGLAEGLALDESKPEVKVINAIVDLLDDIAYDLTDVEELYDELSEQVDEIDEDLAEVESDLYDDEDDDGAPVGFDDEADSGSDGAVYNNARSEIETAFRNYRGAKRLNVSEFWNDAKSVILGSDEVQNKDIIIEDIENRLSQYTDTSALYADIMNQLFGGFGH